MERSVVEAGRRNGRLPALDDLYVLTPAHQSAFARDGQVNVRGLASPTEVAAYRAVILEAAEATAAHAPSAAEGDVYRRAFAQHENLWTASPAVARFTQARRFAAVAAALLEVPAVRLYHDQALFKQAGGGHTPWHQDMHYWPLDTDRAVTMWMPLVDLTPEMGELIFAAGSHHLGAISDIPISERSDAVFEQFLAVRELTLTSTGVMAAGDASFHASWTLHSARPNLTDRRREVMTVIWCADGARVCVPRNDGQRNDLSSWLPGCRPGDLAASQLNPLCFGNDREGTGMT